MHFISKIFRNLSLSSMSISLKKQIARKKVLFKYRFNLLDLKAQHSSNLHKRRRFDFFKVDGNGGGVPEIFIRKGGGCNAKWEGFV